ncbi:MAG: hypothetical protein ACRESJ_28770, partial [Pseudomonas sp.]
APEARLALYGSMLGVLGGGVEIVGVALLTGAGRVQQMSSLSARASVSARAAMQAGRMLARTGAVIGAVTGLFEATQAGMAASRASKNGDGTAAKVYVASAAVGGLGAAFGILTAISTASVLMGPLGISIVLGMAGYGLHQWAKRKESTPLERWAKRCAFGYADETPRVHWDTPEHAPIAIAELNAASLGIEASVEFRLRMTSHPDHHWGGSIGGAGTVAYEEKLEFHLALPYFDPERSDYQWTLRLLREGDNPTTRETGEVAASGSLVAPPMPTTTTIVDGKPAPQMDYQAEDGTPKTNIRSQALPGKDALQVMDISGALVLKPQGRRRRIEGAILTLTYWPDRTVPQGYAALTLTTFSNLFGAR